MIILCKRLKLYSHADANAYTDLPIPRFLSGHFPGFCQFRMEKKELALEMENLYDFPYSLMHIRPSDEISMLKATIKKLEQDMKHV